MTSARDRIAGLLSPKFTNSNHDDVIEETKNRLVESPSPGESNQDLPDQAAQIDGLTVRFQNLMDRMEHHFTNMVKLSTPPMTLTPPISTSAPTSTVATHIPSSHIPSSTQNILAQPPQQQRGTTSTTSQLSLPVTTEFGKQKWPKYTGEPGDLTAFLVWKEKFFASLPGSDIRVLYNYSTGDVKQYDSPSHVTMHNYIPPL